MSLINTSIISNYRRLTGNTKYTVNFFIMFSIPFNLFNFYFPLYMKDRGITDNQIGYLMTITAVTSAVLSLFSGRVIDKIGRKRFLFIIDCMLWPSILIFRIAANDFWLFAIAAVIQSSGVIGNIAFTFMISEDVPNDMRIIGFNLISIISLSSGMFIPVAGGLVSLLGISTAERLLMLFAIASLVTMALWRNKYYVETPTGLKAMKKAKDKTRGGISSFFDYRALRVIAKTPAIASVAVIYILLNLFNIFASFSFSSYYLPYVTEKLNIDKSAASFLGGLLSAALLISSAVIVPAISRRNTKSNIAVGSGFLVFAMLIMIFTPTGGFKQLLAANIIFAVGYSITKPFVDTLLADSVNDVGRASIYAMLTFITNVTSGFTSLFLGRIYSSHAVLLYLFGGIVLLALLCILYIPSLKSFHNKKLL